MTLKIGRDVERFHKIVKGKARQNLRKYISHGEMIGKKGKDLVKIPIPTLDLPHFRYGAKGSGGVGQGDGDIGQPTGQPGDGNSGQSQGGEGQHILEVEVSLDELANWLGQELELPNIEPKGKNTLQTESTNKMTPFHGQLNTRVHRQRTWKEAVKRHMSSGGSHENLPGLVVEKRDKWNKEFEEIPKPEANGRVIYMMDVSGSMEAEQKDIVRHEAWWISLWLRKFYPGLKENYIIHDTVAKEADENTFYHVRESGGTKISSAYGLCADALEGKIKLGDEFINPEEENIYVLHFTDGDNWNEDDKKATDIVAERILGKINMFGYVQVKSSSGNGKFIKTMKNEFKNNEKVRLSEINDKEGIPKSIQDIFGKGSNVKIAA